MVLKQTSPKETLTLKNDYITQKQAGRQNLKFKKFWFYFKDNLKSGAPPSANSKKIPNFE